MRLHTRLLQQNQVTPLAGTENAFSPFFSPDGEWIAFFADGKPTAKMDVIDLAGWTTVANVLLNLDETLMKP